MQTRFLTRNDTAWLKGIAITLIFLHNFCHWLPRCVSENEYTFHIENTHRMVRYLCHGGPHLVLNLFSYFGHYGVPVFLFLSGYGLVRKYERAGAAPLQTGPFMLHNACKLWRLLAGGVLLFIVSDIYRRGSWVHGWDNVVWLFAFVSNFFPHRDLLLGPWWFFSLIMQCYLLYALCFYRRPASWLAAACAVSLGVLTAVVSGLDTPQQHVLDYLRYNVVGCLLPFAFGVAAARFNVRLPLWTLPLSLLMVVWGGFNVYVWLLSPLFAVTAALPLTAVRQPHLRKVGEWLGGVSAALFVFHPVVRPYFVDWARKGAVYEALACYVAASVLLAWGYERLLHRLQKRGDKTA